MHSFLYHVTRDQKFILVQGFKQVGRYAVYRTKADYMPASIYHWPSKCSPEKTPAAVVFPGYREDARGYDLARVCGILHARGFAIYGLNYGGLDLLNENLEEKDSATQESHIEDLRTTLSFIDADQITYFCTSNGLNVALQVMDPRVSEIVALNPFPNFIKRRVQPIVTGNRKLSLRVREAFADPAYGYYVLPDMNRNKVKFTPHFIKSALKYDAFSEVLAEREHKPRITVINMADDIIVEHPDYKGGPSPKLVARWVQHMKDCGYDVRHMPLQGREHSLTQPVFDALKYQL